MKDSTKKILSFAVAGTIVAGVPVSVANAENTNDTVIEESNEGVMSYIVECGDTLGCIANRFYGNPDYYQMIADYNGIEDANVLNVGQIIYLPYLASTLVEQTSNVVSEDKTYTVKCGDTMFCIVRVQYGYESQELVDKLATYNGLADPNRIEVGQELLIPDIEVLKNVVANDYTEEYNRMNCILYHQAMMEQYRCFYRPECNEVVIVGDYYNPCYNYNPCEKPVHPEFKPFPGCEHPEFPHEHHPGCGPKLTLKP